MPDLLRLGGLAAQNERPHHAVQSHPYAWDHSPALSGTGALARCLYLGPMKSMTDRCTGEAAGTWVTSMTLTARGPLTANAAGRFAMAGRVVRTPACGRDGAGGGKGAARVLGSRGRCLRIRG